MNLVCPSTLPHVGVQKFCDQYISDPVFQENIPVRVCGVFRIADIRMSMAYTPSSYADIFDAVVILEEHRRACLYHFAENPQILSPSEEDKLMPEILNVQPFQRCVIGPKLMDLLQNDSGEINQSRKIPLGPRGRTRWYQ